MEFVMDVIENLTHVILIVNLILYVYSWTNQKSLKSVQLLTLYIISLSSIHFLMIYIRLSDNPNNLFLAHYHFGLQFLFLSLFYKNLFKNFQKKIVNLVIIVVFSILITYYVLFPEKYYEFNLIDIFITTVPLIFFSIMHLYNMLTEKRRFFIFNAGVLIYLTTTALIFFLGTFWNTEKEFVGISSETATNIWNINEVLYIIYLLFILIEWKSTFSPWKVKNN